MFTSTIRTNERGENFFKQELSVVHAALYNKNVTIDYDLQNVGFLLNDEFDTNTKRTKILLNAALQFVTTQGAYIKT